MINDKFTQTYLKSLNIIKQDVDEEKKDDITECGDMNPNDEIISDDVDEEEAEDVEISDDEVQTDDAQSEDSEEQQEEKGTCFCFKTTNQTLIDTINSGFDKVVFTVKAKDEETGQDTTTEVEFTADDFADFSECDEAEEDSEDLCPECGQNPCECQGDDVQGEGQDEEFDAKANSFESVFKKYYKSLINEDVEEEQQTSDGQTIEEETDDEVCPECGKTPCECKKDETCPECGEKECTCESVEKKERKVKKLKK